jgi:diaphanous 2
MIFTNFFSCRPGTLKRVKNLKVLDGKTAQNIEILLAGSLKRLSYTDVRRCILQCDNSVITANVLRQLLSYFPLPDQLKKLEGFRSEYSDLTEAEQFVVTVGPYTRCDTFDWLTSLKLFSIGPLLVWV